MDDMKEEEDVDETMVDLNSMLNWLDSMMESIHWKPLLNEVATLMHHINQVMNLEIDVQLVTWLLLLMLVVVDDGAWWWVWLMVQNLPSMLMLVLMLMVVAVAVAVAAVIETKESMSISMMYSILVN